MKVSFYYQTVGLPPPFSFYYELKSALDKQLAVDFIIEYTNRDDLDDEEIFEEGFTLNDDFKWSGVLANPWKDELIALLRNTHLTSEEAEADLSFELVIEKDQEKGYPNNVRAWDYLLQELIQAIYETANKESPLSIELYILRNKALNLELEASFANKLANIMEKKSGRSIAIPWSTLKEVFGLLYHNLDDEIIQRPSKYGIYLQSETEGYQIIKSDKLLNKILKLLE